MRVPNLRIIYQHKEVVAMMLLGGLSLTWFRGHLIDQGDFVLSLNPIDYFRAALNVWDPRWSFGISAPAQVAALPTAAIGALSQVLAVPLIWFEAFLFYVWFTVGGVAMYYMCRTFSFRKSVSLLAGAIYMLNPFTLVIVWQVGQGQLAIPYMTAPLAVGAINEYLLGGNFRKFGLTLLGWFAIGGSSSFADPAYLVIISLPIVVLVIARSLKDVMNKSCLVTFKTVVARTARLSLAFLGINLFWIVPYALSISSQYASLLASQSVWGSLVSNYGLNSASLVNSVRLLGFWALNQGASYGPYYQWGAYYFSLPFIAISFLIPLMLGFSLVNRISFGKLFFALVALIGLFLIGGTQNPFGTINLYIWNHFVFYHAFQETFQRFGFLLCLSFAPLVAEGVFVVFTLIANRVSFRLRPPVAGVPPYIVTLGIVFLLLVVLVFPFWTGSVIQSPAQTSLSPRVEVPNDYYALQSLTSNLPLGSRIISVPLSNSYNVVLQWPGGGYVGSDPTIWFSKVPTIMLDQNNLTELLRIAQNGAYGPDIFARLLALSGVRYIVYQADTNYQVLSGTANGAGIAADEINATLSQFHLFERYPDLLIYSNNYEPYPLFYVPNELFIGNGSMESIISMVGSAPSGVTVASIPCNNDVNLCEDLTGLNATSVQRLAGSFVPNTNSPEITVQQNGRNSYLVTARNSTSSFPLIFEQSFDSGWKVCEGDVTAVQALYSQCSSESSHFIANEFSNGWIMNRTGSFELSVVYEPDGVYDIGLFASILIIVTLAGYVLPLRRIESFLEEVPHKFL